MESKPCRRVERRSTGRKEPIAFGNRRGPSSSRVAEFRARTTFQAQKEVARRAADFVLRARTGPVVGKARASARREQPAVSLPLVESPRQASMLLSFS